MIGTTLAHYRITASLGKGGMGEVWRAEDTKLGREVALKVLAEEFGGDRDRVERFEREARAVAALNHPSIVTIHSVEEADGIRFLTMELIDGETLDRLIPESGMDLSRFLDLATPLAEAMASAHEKGVVHRDLKPSNVMVDDDGRVKVLDFGLAKLQETEGNADSGELPTEALTGIGTLVGTLPYMSPEQVEGRTVDHRTDIFSLGILLYEMALGERPFQGSSSPALMSSILKDAPQPLVERRTDLPRHLGRVIGRCLEKDRRDRYQTARDVFNEFKALRREAESSGARAPDQEIPLYMPPPSSTSGEPVTVAIAVLPFSDMSPARDQDYFCEGMAEEILNALVQVDGIRVASRTSAFRAIEEGKDLQSIGGALSVSQILEGSVRIAGSRLRVTAQLIDVETGYQLWSERYDREAEDVFAVQDEIAGGVVEAVKSRLAPGERTVQAREQVGNLEAYRHYLKGRYLRYTKNDHAGALQSYEEAVRLDPTHGPSWVGMAEVTVLAAFYSLIPTQQAFAKAKECLATAARLQGESGEACYVEGLLTWPQRRWDACDAARLRAFELEPDNVQALGFFGMVLCTRQRLDEGMDYLNRAREVDPLSAFAYAATGVGLLTCGRLEECGRFFEDALSMEAENTIALWGSGIAKVAVGQADAGIAALESAAEHSRRAAVILGILGWAYAVAGRIHEAKDIVGELRGRPESSPTVVTEAWLLAALGEMDEAWEVLARAEEECQGMLNYLGLPPFELFHGDARWDALLERYELT